MSRADDFVAGAMSQLGTPYVWGAEKAGEAFDCSGLVQWAAGLVGVTLPRTAAAQQGAVQQVTTPQPGDLVFWGAPATHVGIYLGNGKMIDAPNSNSVVRIEDVWGAPSGYGRIPGIGSALAPVLGVAGAAVSTGVDALAKASTLLGGARNITIEAAFVTAGVALLGFGAWRSVKGRP